MKFIILSQQRAGSHMLMSLLNSHADIHCNSDSQTVDVKNNGKQWTYDVGFCNDAKINGFLLKIKTDMYKDVTTDDGIRIIYLKRDNLLHVLLSKKMAKLFGCYEKEESGVSLKNATKFRKHAAPINIDSDEAESFFQHWSDKHNDVVVHLSANNINYIEVSYYDLCNETELVVERIYGFLGAEGIGPLFAAGRGAEKLDPRRVSDAILNYYELKEFFSDTKWRSFFLGGGDV